MPTEQDIIERLNRLSSRYSGWLISYDEYIDKRHNLLEMLESEDITFTNDKSIFKDMVDSFSDLIKKY